MQQAEVAHESVTLSVHQELSFQRIKEGGSGSKQKVAETDLLDAVLTPSNELTDGFKSLLFLDTAASANPTTSVGLTQTERRRWRHFCGFGSENTTLRTI